MSDFVDNARVLVSRSINRNTLDNPAGFTNRTYTFSHTEVEHRAFSVVSTTIEYALEQQYSLTATYTSITLTDDTPVTVTSNDNVMLFRYYSANSLNNIIDRGRSVILVASYRPNLNNHIRFAIAGTTRVEYTFSSLISFNSGNISPYKYNLGFFKSIFSVNTFKLSGKIQKTFLQRVMRCTIEFEGLTKEQVNIISLFYRYQPSSNVAINQYISLAGFTTDTTRQQPFLFGDWYRIETLNSYNYTISDNLLGSYDMTVDLQGKY